MPENERTSKISSGKHILEKYQRKKNKSLNADQVSSQTQRASIYENNADQVVEHDQNKIVSREPLHDFINPKTISQTVNSLSGNVLHMSNNQSIVMGLDATSRPPSPPKSPQEDFSSSANIKYKADPIEQDYQISKISENDGISNEMTSGDNHPNKAVEIMDPVSKSSKTSGMMEQPITQSFQAKETDGFWYLKYKEACRIIAKMGSNERKINNELEDLKRNKDPNNGQISVRFASRIIHECWKRECELNKAKAKIEYLESLLFDKRA